MALGDVLMPALLHLVILHVVNILHLQQPSHHPDHHQRQKKLTLVMHHEPSGPGVALEKSTIPEKSGSSGSWMGEKGRSGSGPGPAREEERERAVRTSPAWNNNNDEGGQHAGNILLHTILQNTTNKTQAIISAFGSVTD